MMEKTVNKASQMTKENKDMFKYYQAMMKFWEKRKGLYSLEWDEYNAKYQAMK